MSLCNDATPSPELPMPSPDSAHVSVTPEPKQQRYTFAGSPRPGAPYSVQDLPAPNIRTLNFWIVKYVINIHTMYIKDSLVVWDLSLTIVWCSNPKSKRNHKKLLEPTARLPIPPHQGQPTPHPTFPHSTSHLF